jgi:hypothetical protein
MIDSPINPSDHPDRIIDCEMAAEHEFLALVERIEAAGWTSDETAAALLLLAQHFQTWRKVTAAAEARMWKASKKAGQ